MSHNIFYRDGCLFCVRTLCEGRIFSSIRMYRDVRFEVIKIHKIKKKQLLIIATRFTTMLKHPIREDAPPGKRLKPINAPTTEADSSALSAEGSTYITSSSAGGLCTTTATTSSSTTTTNSSAGAAALVRSADDAASSPSSPSYRHSPKSATDNQLDKENEKMMAFLCGRTPHRSSSAPTTTTTSPTTNKKTRTKAFKFPMKVRNTIYFAASSIFKSSKTDPSIC
jgi:hypothetical protein